MLFPTWNMHHRTSTDLIRQSMCDIWVCISWPENHENERASTESIRQSMCDISCPEKLQHASSHIYRVDSPVDVRYLVLYLLATKITTCIIAHLPIRFTSRCAISAFVSLGQKITTCIIAHRPSATSPLFFDNLHFGQIAKSVNPNPG